MVVQAYLNFQGNAKEVFEYYSDVFNVKKKKIMLFEEMPANAAMPLAAGTEKLVANAWLDVGGSEVMLSDVPPGMPFTAGNNFSLIVSSSDVEQIRTLFGKLAKGGKIGMPLQETFWSKAYGALTDKFGVGWQFNHDVNAQ